MLLNLFSIFDPSTSNMWSLNWFSLFMFLLFIPISFWISHSRLIFISKMFFSKLIKEIKNNFSSFNLISLIIFGSLFLFIFFNNILGLFPYIFTATSHLSVTLTLALPMWILFMIFGWLNLMNSMFCHLIPLGTPMALSFFMVFIESISNIIRPITLSVRLAANMIAGHLLLSLLSNLSEKMFSLFLITLPALIALLILEFAVSIIQSYVFMVLLTLYLNEI
uniref:ATP synthase subunit a n=1 Tax=Hypoaspis linteyini TaxID=2695865 RepID=A0A6B9WG15_9ACAR|nr:ATP synthase F0 subunit 6 [Hypoaspis linteyini]QHQ98577.1 ATP synthase subunit 6 [Hypoaspis linteyini]